MLITFTKLDTIIASLFKKINNIKQIFNVRSVPKFYRIVQYRFGVKKDFNKNARRYKKKTDSFSTMFVINC